MGFQGVLLPPAIQVVDEAPLDPLVISGQGRAVSSPGSGHMAGESPGCLQAGAQSGDNAGRGERVEGAGCVSHREPAGADGPVTILYRLAVYVYWTLVLCQPNERATRGAIPGRVPLQSIGGSLRLPLLQNGAWVMLQICTLPPCVPCC